MKKIFVKFLSIAFLSMIMLSCRTANVGGVGRSSNVNSKPTVSATKPIIKIDPAAKKIVTLKVISCYGDSQTGDVNIVISATALGRNTEMELGNYLHVMEAYDIDGNLFKGKEIAVDGKSGKKDLPKDIPVKFEYAFIDVPSNLSTLEVIKSDFNMWSDNGKCYGEMQLKNVAIQWDVK